MQAYNIDIPFKEMGEEHNISLYSDVHLGSSHSATDIFTRHYTRREALPNHRALFLGDTWDFVMPDDPRYSPSQSTTQGTDNILGEELQQASFYFKEHQAPELILMGNHEHNVLKRHKIDMVEALASRIGAIYGGYSCFLRYTFRASEGAEIHGKRTVTFLLHHGAWGGSVVKGKAGASRYAAGFEGWDVFAFGHNHQCHAHHETIVGLSHKTGRLVHKDSYMVNTGTFLRTATQDMLGYGEMRGYRPVALAAPLVTLTPRRDGVEIKIGLGDT